MLETLEANMSNVSRQTKSLGVNAIKCCDELRVFPLVSFFSPTSSLSFLIAA